MVSHLHSLKIERKTISIADDTSRTSHFRISEVTADKSFSLSFPRNLLGWLMNSFKRLCDVPLNQKLFIEKKSEEANFWVEKISSKKGYCAEITKLGCNGGLNRILVPIGADREGWIGLTTCINSFINFTPTSCPSQIDRPSTVINQRQTTYKEALKSNTERKALEFPLTTNKSPLSSHPQSLVPLHLQTSVIIQRMFFHDSWIDIRTALQETISFFISVSPIQPDLALLTCIDEHQANKLIGCKDWQKVEGFQLRFHPWCPNLIYENTKVPSYGGWLKIRNLPINLWSVELFRKIGDVCGGYLETATKTLARLDLMEVCIKVKKNHSGFIPAVVQISKAKEQSLLVHIDPLFREDLYIQYQPAIHGTVQPQSMIHAPRDTRSETDLTFSSPKKQDQAKKGTAVKKNTFYWRPVQKVISTAPKVKDATAALCIEPSSPVSPGKGLQKSPKAPLSSDSLEEAPTKTHLPTKSLWIVTNPPIALRKSGNHLQVSAQQNSPFLPCSLTSELKAAPYPSIIDPLPSIPDLTLGKKIVINNKITHLVTGTIHSSCKGLSLSDSEADLSSPGTINTEVLITDELALAIIPPASPGSLYLEPLFDEPEPEPLQIREPFNDQNLCAIDCYSNRTEPIRFADTQSPIEVEMNKEQTETNKKKRLMEPTETEYRTDLEGDRDVGVVLKNASDREEQEAATVLHIIFPWLAKYGLCIMPIPSTKKATVASKKKQRGIRELMSLKSSIHYKETPATKHRIGSSNHK